MRISINYFPILKHECFNFMADWKFIGYSCLIAYALCVHVYMLNIGLFYFLVRHIVSETIHDHVRTFFSSSYLNVEREVELGKFFIRWIIWCTWKIFLLLNIRTAHYRVIWKWVNFRVFCGNWSWIFVESFWLVHVELTALLFKFPFDLSSPAFR